jgi:hypothetical protein
MTLSFDAFVMYINSKLSVKIPTHFIIFILLIRSKVCVLLEALLRIFAKLLKCLPLKQILINFLIICSFDLIFDVYKNVYNFNRYSNFVL